MGKTIDIEVRFVMNLDKFRGDIEKYAPEKLEEFDNLSLTEWAEKCMDGLKEEYEYEIERGELQIHFVNVSEGLMLDEVR